MSVNEGQTVQEAWGCGPALSDLQWHTLDSGPSRAVNNIVEDVTDAISDRPLDYDENGDSRPKSSDLSPIEDISEIRSIQKDATSPMLKNCPHLTVRTIPQKSEWAREATDSATQEDARMANETPHLHKGRR